MNILANLNLNGNELQNVVLQVLASAPANPAEGQMYYDSTDKIAKQYKGATKGWEPIGELNVIETVKVNGSALTPSNKAVDITVPTDTGDLTNEAGFITLDDLPEGVQPYASTPEMDGVASAGESEAFARGDHVHPSDTSKLDVAGGTMSGNIAMGSNKITGMADPTADQDAATKKYVDGLLAANDAMVFKGTIGAQADTPTVTALPDTHNAGWTYRVVTAGTYAGIACEIGDLIICVNDGTAAANGDWTVAQTNIDGAVTGPASSTSGHIPTFNGTSGRVLQDGYGVASAISNDSTSLPTTAAVNTAINGLIKTATGTIATTGTTATVAFSGTLINAFATMGGAEVWLDIAPGANSVVFTCAQNPSAAVTCTVVYA